MRLELTNEADHALRIRKLLYKPMYKQLNNDELLQIFLYPLILYYLRLTGKLVLLTIAKNNK